MTLFYGTWKIMDSARVPCMTYFASMTEQDDKNESQGVDVLGRWSDIGTASGHVVCRADSYTQVMSWIYNWVPMATCSVKPICDDNVAREIILGQEPSFRVDYSAVGDQPLNGETLYAIQYSFNEGKRVEGNQLFANLTKEQDEQDSGNCRCLGRWHDLGNGSGFAVAGARNEKDIYRWANNWASMCECKIVPVLTDRQARAVIRQKPDYEKKLRAVQKSMKPSSLLCKMY